MQHTILVGDMGFKLGPEALSEVFERMQSGPILHDVPSNGLRLYNPTTATVFYGTLVQGVFSCGGDLLMLTIAHDRHILCCRTDDAVLDH